MKKIWGDPVWSKVISTGIVAGITFLSVFIYSLFTKENFNVVFKKIMNYSIPVYIVLIIIFGILIAYYIISLIFNKRPSSQDREYAKKINAFIGNNYKFTFTNLNVLCRYSIGVSSYTGRPFVHHLKLYCNNHNPPLEIFAGKCNVSGCSNSNINISEFDAQRHLESEAANQWDRYDEAIKK